MNTPAGLLKPLPGSRVWRGKMPPRPRETGRLCMGCRKPMWLSVEGFRCLECKYVYCRSCAKDHFKQGD